MFSCLISKKLRNALLSILFCINSLQVYASINADAVLSYDLGGNQFQFHLYDDPAAVLGQSPRDTGFGYLVSPFNNPWGRGDVVSVGLGGYMTLKLEKYVNISVTEKELGVFTFQQFFQASSGGTYADARMFYESMQASVEVSENGYAWSALNNGELLSFDLPANGFNLDRSEADYGKPTDLLPQDLGGLSYSEIVEQYDGSAGGNWLDLSSTGYEKVGYIRFKTEIDQAFSFQLEGVSINNALVGDLVPDRILGDAQGDGIINQLDLQIVMDHLGQSLTLGDVNYDGVTNLADLFEVRNRFEISRDGAVIVPEPCVFVLGAGGFLILGCGSRKRLI